MALEAVVFPQDPFGNYNGKDLYNLLGGGGLSNWGYDLFSLEKVEEDEKSSFLDNNYLENQTETSNCHHHLYGGDWNSPPPPSASTSMVPHFSKLHLQNSPSDANNASTNSGDPLLPLEYASTTATNAPPARPKRRRSKSKKNKEEIENQRMTHIAVERNRRKQMNEYLSVLRSLMPESYVQRGDQASIVGGAINFVKELEQQLQSLGAQKEMKEESAAAAAAMPFSEFFTFPQYTTTSSCHGDNSVSQSGVADIEVTMVDSHANLKIRSKRRPKQLLKVVSGLHSLRLTTLHLNVTTHDQFALYSLSLKVEDDCMLNAVDEIATAVYQMLGRIQEEAMLS